MNAETQFLAPTVEGEEDELDRSLRPRRLDDFVGQERIRSSSQSRCRQPVRAARRSTTCC